MVDLVMTFSRTLTTQSGEISLSLQVVVPPDLKEDIAFGYATRLRERVDHLIYALAEDEALPQNMPNAKSQTEIHNVLKVQKNTKGNKITYTVFTDKTAKFGIQVFPEILERCDLLPVFNTESVFDALNLGYTCEVQKDNGKYRKVLRIIKS